MINSAMDTDTEWEIASEIQRFGDTYVKGNRLIKCMHTPNELKIMQDLDDLCNHQTDERNKRGCRATMRLDDHGKGNPCPRDVPWLKMLYANLGSLKSFLERQLDDNNPISPIGVREHIRDDLRSALDLLGTTNWVHGDIKPDNIVLQQDIQTGAVSGILVDYGAAQLSGTRGYVRGTLAYLPAYVEKEEKESVLPWHPYRPKGTLMQHGLDRYGWVLTMYELSMGRRLLAVDKTNHLTWVNWERSTSCPESAHEFLQSESLYAYARSDYREDKIPKHLLPRKEDRVRYAVRKGHLNILRNCRVERVWANFREILNLASTHGHFDIVHWVFHQVATVPEEDIRIAILHAAFGEIAEPSRYKQLEDVIVFLRSMVGSEVPYNCPHCKLSMAEAFNHENRKKRKLLSVPHRHQYL